MLKFAGALAAALLVAGSALAQDSGTNTAPNAGADGTGFIVATPVQGSQAPQKPDPLAPFIRDTFGDWKVECRHLKEGDHETCQIRQLLRLPNGTPVIEVSIGPLPPGQAAVAGAIVVTPLETLLLKQLSITIDGGDPMHYPFAFCNPKGCVSRAGFTAPELAQLEKGKSAELTIFALGNSNPVQVSMSLNGFSKAYDSLLN